MATTQGYAYNWTTVATLAVWIAGGLVFILVLVLLYTALRRRLGPDPAPEVVVIAASVIIACWIDLEVAGWLAAFLGLCVLALGCSVYLEGRRLELRGRCRRTDSAGWQAHLQHRCSCTPRPPRGTVAGESSPIVGGRAPVISAGQPTSVPWLAPTGGGPGTAAAVLPQQRAAEHGAPAVDEPQTVPASASAVPARWHLVTDDGDPRPFAVGNVVHRGLPERTPVSIPDNVIAEAG